jgi:hypothetical protein
MSPFLAHHDGSHYDDGMVAFGDEADMHGHVAATASVVDASSPP